MVLVYLEKKAWGREQRGRGSLLQGSPLHRQPVCLGVLQHVKGQGSGVGISPQPAATSSAECTFLRAARGWGQRGRLSESGLERQMPSGPGGQPPALGPASTAHRPALQTLRTAVVRETSRSRFMDPNSVLFLAVIQWNVACTAHGPHGPGVTSAPGHRGIVGSPPCTPGLLWSPQCQHPPWQGRPVWT